MSIENNYQLLVEMHELIQELKQGKMENLESRREPIRRIAYYCRNTEEYKSPFKIGGIDPSWDASDCYYYLISLLTATKFYDPKQKQKADQIKAIVELMPIIDDKLQALQREEEFAWSKAESARIRALSSEKLLEEFEKTIRDGIGPGNFAHIWRRRELADRLDASSLLCWNAEWSK
jgi:hypothetical protein